MKVVCAQRKSDLFCKGCEHAKPHEKCEDCGWEDCAVTEPKKVRCTRIEKRGGSVTRSARDPVTVLERVQISSVPPDMKPRAYHATHKFAVQE